MRSREHFVDSTAPALATGTGCGARRSSSDVSDGADARRAAAPSALERAQLHARAGRERATRPSTFAGARGDCHRGPRARVDSGRWARRGADLPRLPCFHLLRTRSRDARGTSTRDAFCVPIGDLVEARARARTAHPRLNRASELAVLGVSGEVRPLMTTMRQTAGPRQLLHEASRTRRPTRSPAHDRARETTRTSRR